MLNNIATVFNQKIILYIENSFINAMMKKVKLVHITFPYEKKASSQKSSSNLPEPPPPPPLPSL